MCEQWDHLFWKGISNDRATISGHSQISNNLNTCKSCIRRSFRIIIRMTRLVIYLVKWKKVYNVYSMSVLCRQTSLIVSERFKSVFELFWSLKGDQWSWNVQATNGCNAERSGKPWKVRACNAFNRLVELIIVLLASLTAHHRLLPLKAILICDKRWETLMNADRIRWFYTFEFFLQKWNTSSKC